jgi:hypothetical protein
MYVGSTFARAQRAGPCVVVHSCPRDRAMKLRKEPVGECVSGCTTGEGERWRKSDDAVLLRHIMFFFLLHARRWRSRVVGGVRWVLGYPPGSALETRGGIPTVSRCPLLPLVLLAHGMHEKQAGYGAVAPTGNPPWASCGCRVRSPLQQPTKFGDIRIHQFFRDVYSNLL